MKKHTITLLSTLLLATPLCFAQGSLTPPPGAPGPVMKSLDQIEARTPLVAGSPGVSIDASNRITINQSGSYYLTGNRSVASGNAILINSNDVTLDLNGFTLISTASPASGSGIMIGNGLRNISIFNGHIRGSVTNSGSSYSGNGFSSGISYNTNRPSTTRVSNVSVSGCMGSGIDLGGKFGKSNIVEACVVQTVSTFGIAANVIRNCSATECGLFGLFGQIVTDSISTTYGNAISADVVENCHGTGFGSAAAVLADVSVSNSYGETTSNGIGIECNGTVSFSRGKASGTAIFAPITIGCTTGGGSISSAQKHLGTP
jgi:hypothetical protein